MNFNLFTASLLVVLVFGGQFVLSEKSCQEKRREAEDQLKRQGSASSLAIVVPNCNPDGSYAPLQCFANSEFCLCWDKTGSPVTQPKTKLRECSCMMKRADELKSIPASRQGEAQLTSCETSGLYTARQCKAGSCWCVNPKTGSKTGSTGTASLKC